MTETESKFIFFNGAWHKKDGLSTELMAILELRFIEMLEMAQDIQLKKLICEQAAELEIRLMINEQNEQNKAA